MNRIRESLRQCRPEIWLSYIYIFAGILLLLSSTGLSEASSNISPFVIFDTNINACSQQDFPDQPARAFRDSNGIVHLFAYHYDVTADTGTDLLRTMHTCSVVFRSPLSKDPSDFDDYDWLTSFYTEDGKNVFAIVHEEFHGGEVKRLCLSQNNFGCIQASVGEAVSKNGGYSFSRALGAADLVATLPLVYQGDQKSWYGFMNPTNIITDGAHEYFMVSFGTPVLKIPAQPHKSGLCLFRTEDPSDPHSWRAWDGRSFSIQLEDPYTDASLRYHSPPCAPIDTGGIEGSLGSILWHPVRKIFILTLRCQRWTKGCAPGAYISTSRDLINWTKAEPLLLDSEASPDDIPELYPSLMDPKASDRNFQETGDFPWLFTVQSYKRGKLPERRLVAFPMHLPPG